MSRPQILEVARWRDDRVGDERRVDEHHLHLWHWRCRHWQTRARTKQGDRGKTKGSHQPPDDYLDAIVAFRSNSVSPAASRMPLNRALPRKGANTGDAIDSALKNAARFASARSRSPSACAVSP